MQVFRVVVLAFLMRACAAVSASGWLNTGCSSVGLAKKCLTTLASKARNPLNSFPASPCTFLNVLAFGVIVILSRASPRAHVLQLRCLTAAQTRWQPEP